jgi:hypothetical protein
MTNRLLCETLRERAASRQRRTQREEGWQEILRTFLNNLIAKEEKPTQNKQD